MCECEGEPGVYVPMAGLMNLRKMALLTVSMLDSGKELKTTCV